MKNNKITIRILSVLLSIALLLTLTSCSNGIELGDTLIVEGVGIDKNQDNEYILTMQLFDASDKDDTSSDTTKVIYSNGKSILEAFNNASLQTGKTLLYSQNMILVVGENVAMTTNLYEFMDFFVRHYQARPDVYVFVSKCNASDILSAKKDDKYISASEILSLGQNSSTKINSTIKQVISDMENRTSEPVITTINIADIFGEKSIYEDGLAIFSDNKLAGYLNNDEARGISFVRGKNEKATVIIPINEDIKATFSVENTNSNIDFEVINDIPTYTVYVNVKLNLYEIDSKDGKYNNLDLNSLKETINEQIKNVCYTAIYDTTHNYNSDVCNFGKVLLQQDTDFYKNCEQEFNSNLKNMKFDIVVNSDIDITGQEESI